ncbi:MAG: hypothetical protein A3H98_00750 [Bacteroidetes bacterium RIFCSPLOWO2_02_FULL_36_8]|nr:MAG: hypothetical protein A3H98_00750 [Bacteroidetes bacterium RIFCSPLOWO2_02_FULL_36_8]OFY70609.1 MAG: hypothetical protein A3G23_07715 [Bacteroidetes bacterium RIFCSPLOWO2_12_FULL_37_12]
MAHALTFDTLAYAKKLIAVGVPVQQAEVQAETFAEIIDENLATKQDIIDLKRNMKEIEQRIIIKLGAMITASIAITVTLVKLL